MKTQLETPLHTQSARDAAARAIGCLLSRLGIVFRHAARLRAALLSGVFLTLATLAVLLGDVSVAHAGSDAVNGFFARDFARADIVGLSTVSNPPRTRLGAGLYGARPPRRSKRLRQQNSLSVHYGLYFDQAREAMLLRKYRAQGYIPTTFR